MQWSITTTDFIFSVLEQQKESWPGPIDNIFPHLVILCMLMLIAALDIAVVTPVSVETQTYVAELLSVVTN